MPTLRELQAEWNALVPVAHSLGIYSGVRILRSVHENVQIGTQRVSELRRRIALRQPRTDTAIPYAVTGAPSVSTHTGDTFGVELEVILPLGYGHSDLARAITAAGETCRAEGYNHHLTTSWKVVTDGSLGSYTSGAEVVSPVLSGDAGKASLKKVMDAMKAFGCKINRKCGFHVHVGARREQVSFFRNLARIYRRFDSAINSFLAPSRRNNSFCYTHSINETALEQATTVHAITRGVGQQPGLSYVRTHWRYRKLNFCSFWQHGTVEFRQHQGTVEFEKADRWIDLCLAMVSRAREGVDLTGTVDTVDSLM